jgi:hypothetical protein
MTIVVVLRCSRSPWQRNALINANISKHVRRAYVVLVRLLSFRNVQSRIRQQFQRQKYKSVTLLSLACVYEMLTLRTKPQNELFSNYVVLARLENETSF